MFLRINVAVPVGIIILQQHVTSQQKQSRSNHEALPSHRANFHHGHFHPLCRRGRRRNFLPLGGRVKRNSISLVRPGIRPAHPAPFLYMFPESPVLFQGKPSVPILIKLPQEGFSGLPPRRAGILHQPGLVLFGQNSRTRGVIAVQNHLADEQSHLKAFQSGPGGSFHFPAVAGSHGLPCRKREQTERQRCGT